MTKPLHQSRRRMLVAAASTGAGLTLGTVLPSTTWAAAKHVPAAAGSADGTSSQSTDITGQLARYMVGARDTPLSPAVALACKHRILDTLGAMISGSQMPAGEAARKYVTALAGAAQASVIASNLKTTTIDAALANAMAAHADETDDFEPVTKAHPGCSTVPAALAMAEFHQRSGEQLLRAVALGYDMACRLLMALGPDLVRGGSRSAEGTASTFGALGAAAALAALDERQSRFAISYASQQVSGLWSWVKDKDHIEKAFDFAGMGARNGVTAVSMVASGMTGVWDVLDGTHNLFIALSPQPKPAEMVADLGRRFYVTETAIKTYSVGYPIQSPLDALLALRKQYGLTPDNVKSIVVRIPPDAIGIVGDSAMPDVNCAHLVALALVKGAVSFADSHDTSLLRDPRLLAEQKKISVVADQKLKIADAPRGAIVDVTMTDGKQVSHYTKYAPGTKENPLDTAGVVNKTRDLIEPVLGHDKADKLIDAILHLENVGDFSSLRPLLTT